MNLTTIKIINWTIGLKISVSSIFDVRATWWHPNKTEIVIALKFSPAVAYLLSRGCREDISSSGKPPGTRMTHKPIGEKRFSPLPRLLSPIRRWNRILPRESRRAEGWNFKASNCLILRNPGAFSTNKNNLDLGWYVVSCCGCSLLTIASDP